MSQRIEKGTKFTPSMGGMAGRRRPAARGPAAVTAAAAASAPVQQQKQQQQKQPPSSVPTPAPAPAPTPTSQNEPAQESASSPPPARNDASGSMAPPTLRRAVGAASPTAGGSTPHKQPVRIQPSPVGVGGTARSPTALTNPTPTRSYVRPGSSSAFTPGASRAAMGGAGSPPPSGFSSSARRPSTSSTSSSGSTFKPPTLTSSSSSARRQSVSSAAGSDGGTVRASSVRPRASGGETDSGERDAADADMTTASSPPPARRRLPPTFGSSRVSASGSSSAAGPSAFTPRRPVDDASTSTPSSAADATSRPRDGAQATPSATTSDTRANDNALAIDAALAHMNKTASADTSASGSKPRYDDSQQHNEFAPRPASIAVAPPEERPEAARRSNGSSAPAPTSTSDGPPRKRTRTAKTSSSSSSRSNRAALPEGHPSKPLTAYFLFLAQRRPSIRAENPDAPVSDVAKKCGEQWRNLPSTEKATFEEQAALAKQRYEEQVQAWKDSTPDWAQQLARAGEPTDDDDDADEQPKTKRRKRAQVSRRRGGPKRPPSAYLLYAQEQRANTNSSADGGAANAKETFAETNKRIGSSWRILPLEEKERYLAQSQTLREQYERDLAKWNEDHPDGSQTGDDDDDDDDDDGAKSDAQPRRRTVARRPRQVEEKSITDEEKEYEALVAEHGEDLVSLQLDKAAVNMSDLTSVEYRHGVVSKRTFELDRVRKKQLEEALSVRMTAKERIAEKRRLMKENLRKRREGQEVVLPRYDPKTDTSSGRRHGFQSVVGGGGGGPPEMPTAAPPANGDEEIISGDEDDVEDELGGRPQDKARAREQERERFRVPDLGEGEGGDESDEDADEDKAAVSRRKPSRAKGNKNDDDSSDADDSDSDTGSVRSATSAGTYHSLRDNANAPQMRMVNGKLVLDETSLQIDRSHGAGAIVDEDEVFEEEATHKFVNTATSSKREKATRWNVKETDEFFRAVSMWGTDFEMISRMFPNRSRKQIKAKWVKEERASPKRLDAAFAKRVPVDLGDYAIMANVDLSGPPPQVSVNGKTEADLDAFKGEHAGRDGENEDADDVDGGEGASRRIKKASQTPDPFATRRGGSQGPPTAESKRSKQSEREQRKARERARRTGVSGNAYEMEEEVVDEPPPE